jgi:hypothetical protein
VRSTSFSERFETDMTNLSLNSCAGWSPPHMTNSGPRLTTLFWPIHSRRICFPQLDKHDYRRFHFTKPGRQPTGLDMERCQYFTLRRYSFGLSNRFRNNGVCSIPLQAITCWPVLWWCMHAYRTLFCQRLINHRRGIAIIG